MTTAPTHVSPAPAARAASAEVTAIDTTARGPLLFLLGSGIVWLVVSGVLALITSIQLHSPHFLEDCSCLTFGRAQALAQTAFVYGWLGNAGAAIALWLLGRLGGAPLRALNWVLVGALFWNAGVTAGLVGIGVGDMTSFSLLQLPRYVQPLLLFAWAAMAIAGVLAWSGRHRDHTFASQWYAVGALFLFPWLLSAAQVVLIWAPVRGTLQAVAANWFAQSLWSLWLAPIALAAAYYLVPKVSGRVLPSYRLFAALGFWTLIVIGPWTAGRHLIGGPVPAWIATIAVAASVALLFHYLVLVLNLRVAVGAGGTAGKFVTFGLGAYVLGGVLDALTSFRGVAVETQFTVIDPALEQLALYGAISMLFFGAIYFMVPRLTGRAWTSSGLTLGHRFLVKIGLVILLVSLGVGGWTQGVDLLNAKTGFADILGHLNLCLLAASAAQLVLLAGNLLLAVNFFQSICVWSAAPAPAENYLEAAAVEARVS
ncbi:MAG TPA: cbb3-type cytochrome c oxidase subunit I [Opitutaceae bacterium]|nr:cbb3-type cytochrome c oxidase subunit I [Opitutaceae bacterium]